MKMIHWLEATSGMKNEMAKWESRKWIVWHSDFAVLSQEHSTDPTLWQVQLKGRSLGTTPMSSTGKWGRWKCSPMVCSSSSPWQFRWTQVKLPLFRPSSELGLDRDGLQKWAVFHWPSAEAAKPSRDAGMELKLPQAAAWAWPCHRARAERLWTPRNHTSESLLLCTGSASDQFYCLKPSLLWQTLNIPRARAALPPQKRYTTL